MNSLPLLLALCIASIGGTSVEEYPSPNSKRAEELALSADKVVIRGERESDEKGLVVKDMEWINKIGRALGLTPLVESEHVFGIGYLTAFFYRNGEQVLSVAAVTGGHHLRVHSKKGGDDFIVDERHWKVIADLIHEESIANKAPQSTTPDITPPAGQEARQP